MKRLQSLGLAVVLAASAVHASAEDVKPSDIAIQKPWARATPKGAQVGAVYLVIRNNGATPDRLTGGTTDFATIEVHQMTSEGGVMKMGQMKDGLSIPAHSSVGLAPGGYHLMLTHLTHPLNKGDAIKATLNFEHAGPVEVQIPVMAVGAAGPDAGSGGAKKPGDMGGMKM
jgi:copper(I)-binding protein